MEAKIEGRAPLDPAPRGIEKLKSKKPEYSEQEARLAESLVEKDARTVLLQLAQARGKARSADTKSDADAKIIANLHDSHLILREYLVLCRQDSHTICSLRDRSQLGGESGLDLRCSICGRPFRDENVQEIFALSDSATKLLDGSVWLSIWVTELLKRAGVPGTSILWNATAGEDEIDIVADLYGSRVFFELKDRDFGLGDAYPFAFRIQRYGGRHGVVVSTGNVADEVKALFRERTPGVASAPIDVVEGAHAISRNLPELIDSLSRSPALRVAAELGESMGVNLLPLVSAWMKRVSSPARASE